MAAERGGDLVGICTAYYELSRFASATGSGSRTRGAPRASLEGDRQALLDAAKEWARERGATHLELDSAETRADAHRFYEREGAQYRSYSFGWEL